MNRVKTELSSVEDHKPAVSQAIARRPYELYEMDGSVPARDLLSATVRSYPGPIAGVPL